MRDVAGHAPLVAPGQLSGGSGRPDDRLHARAARARGELVVLLLEPAARPEQRALDRRPAEAHALADLAVREALELAQHEDLVMGVRQPAECAAQVVQPLLDLDRLLRRGRR